LIRTSIFLFKQVRTSCFLQLENFVTETKNAIIDPSFHSTATLHRFLFQPPACWVLHGWDEDYPLILLPGHRREDDGLILLPGHHREDDRPSVRSAQTSSPGKRRKAKEDKGTLRPGLLRTMSRSG